MSHFKAEARLARARARFDENGLTAQQGEDDWHSFGLPWPQGRRARVEQAGGEADIHDRLRCVAFAEIAGTADRLEVLAAGPSALAPRHHVVALHQMEGDIAPAEMADAALQLPWAPGLLACECSPGIECHIGRVTSRGHGGAGER